MMETIKDIFRIVREEAQRRTWVSALKAAVELLSILGLSILGLDVLLRRLFPESLVASWVIIVSLSFIIVLLAVIKFMHAHLRRVVAETRAEWDRRDPLLKKLYALSVRGEHLKQLCDDRSRAGEPLSNEDLRQVRVWHQDAAYQLENRLGIEYRRRFYEHSPTGETAPTRGNECSVWVHTRRHKIEEVIAELRVPPPRLISGAEAKQFAETGFLAGRNFNDD